MYQDIDSAPFLSKRLIVLTMSTIEDLVKFISFSPPSDVTMFSDDDWESIAVTAIVLGLAPLLHRHFEQCDITSPPMTMAKLSITRQAHVKRNQAIAGQLAEILAACTPQNIAVMVLKGALLAPKVYAEASLRPMNDIDLLFHADDLPKVDSLLINLGYQGKHKEASQGPGVTKHLATYRRIGENGATPNPYLSAAAGRTVEPHGSLEESWFGLKVDITPGVWDRAVPISLHGQSACRLSANDTILHLSVHAAFHVIMGASVFVQLYDIGRVLEVWSDELDWSEIICLTRQARAQPFTYAALYWAKTLYQAPVPDTPLQTLKAECSPNLIAYIQSLDATRLFKRTQQPSLVTLKQRLNRGIFDRREAARWAGSPAEKWQIWKTALAFHKTDTAGLLTGKRLSEA